MFTASAQLNVTLICGPTDMRKAIDGLCNIGKRRLIPYDYLTTLFETLPLL